MYLQVGGGGWGVQGKAPLNIFGELIDSVLQSIKYVHEFCVSCLHKHEYNEIYH